jgi:hypothetical protein
MLLQVIFGWFKQPAVYNKLHVPQLQTEASNIQLRLGDFDCRLQARIIKSRSSISPGNAPLPLKNYDI